MKHGHKGRRAEHKARASLIAAGYVVVRAAGSRGPIDLVAWHQTALRLLQVKCGTARVSRAERAALVALPRPVGASVEVWTYRDHARAPQVERV